MNALAALALLVVATLGALVFASRRLGLRRALIGVIASAIGGALGAIPGAIFVVGWTVVASTGTGAGSSTPSTVVLGVGGLGAALLGLRLSEWRLAPARAPALAWALAVAGAALGIGLGLGALTLAQNTPMELPVLALVVMVLPSATLAGYAIYAPPHRAASV